MDTVDKIKSEAEEANFTSKVRQTLEITRSELAQILTSVAPHVWVRSQQIVEQFQPVPWFIWRLSNFVFGQNGRPNKVGEGMVMGLRKVLLAAASDKVLGKGSSVDKTKDAIKIVRSDVVAAISIIHSISRKLHSKEFSRAWLPLLEDSIVRAHIGFFVGQMNLDFGPGRGMLAGFAGKIGLAILISTGTEAQAEESLFLISEGKTLSQVGEEVYGVNPLQVSAMTLSACGCGKDSSYGTVAYSMITSDGIHDKDLTFEQKQWLSACQIVEAVRTSNIDNVTEDQWKVLGFGQESDKDDLKELVKILIRKGHGWDWLV